MVPERYLPVRSFERPTPDAWRLGREILMLRRTICRRGLIRACLFTDAEINANDIAHGLMGRKEGKDVAYPATAKLPDLNSLPPAAGKHCGK
jgi:hypothetical protein